MLPLVARCCTRRRACRWRLRSALVSCDRGAVPPAVAGLAAGYRRGDPVVSWLVTPVAAARCGWRPFRCRAFRVDRRRAGCSALAIPSSRCWRSLLGVGGCFAVGPTATGCDAALAVGRSGLLGMAWLLAPPGWPSRWLGARAGFPMFVWPGPPYGEDLW